MRRRRADVIGSLPAELTDPALWPQCARWDGAETQACVCWWAAQAAFLDAGGEWPGGEGRELTDFLEMQRRHPCREPFDGSTV